VAGTEFKLFYLLSELAYLLFNLLQFFLGLLINHGRAGIAVLLLYFDFMSVWLESAGLHLQVQEVRY